jgi:adenosylcobinamide-GDP ribazoletransferase
VIEQCKLFLLAVQFFTRIPVRGRLNEWVGYSPERLSQSTRYFPLVGGLVALLMGIVYAPCALYLPQGISVIITLAFGVWLTGAFHEDGWIDFCDAFGGHRDKAQTLAIMQDSRIGSYGAIAIVLLMAFKIEALAALDPTWIGVSLLAAHVWSRMCAVFVMRSLPYAKPDDDSKAKPIAQNLQMPDALIAAVLTLLLMSLAVWLSSSARPFVMGAGGSLVGMFYLRRMMRRRLGGYSGDGLGAVQQITEALFYLGILIALSADNVEVTIDPTS